MDNQHYGDRTNRVKVYVFPRKANKIQVACKKLGTIKLSDIQGAIQV